VQEIEQIRAERKLKRERLGMTDHEHVNGGRRGGN
jgi:hypothetical protein